MIAHRGPAAAGTPRGIVNGDAPFADGRPVYWITPASRLKRARKAGCWPSRPPSSASAAPAHRSPAIECRRVSCVRPSARPPVQCVRSPPAFFVPAVPLCSVGDSPLCHSKRGRRENETPMVNLLSYGRPISSAPREDLRESDASPVSPGVREIDSQEETAPHFSSI